MKDQLLKIYIFEIFSQKEFAIKSYEGFVDSLKIKKSPKECLYHIHHFLVHVGNIIKILFPADNKKNPDNNFIQERAKNIQEKLNLSESDFDIHEIGVRNDFEHYDTRIDFWVKNSKNHNYCDMNIISKGSISGLDIKDMFRNLDPKSNILTFCGKEYNLEYLRKFLIEKIVV